MGTPIEPPPPGPACPLCWGAVDSPFGSDPAPESLQISVSGVQQGDAWEEGDGDVPAGVYTLVPTGTCSWGRDGVPEIGLFLTTGNSRIVILPFVPLLSFLADVDEECVSAYDNELDDPAGVFFGGSVTLLV